jgi:hypothetical protein
LNLCRAPYFLSHPFSEIQIDADKKYSEEYDSCIGINQFCRDIDICQFKDKKMYVGRTRILIAKHLTYLPVPIRANTITPAKPNTKYEP